jgi:hypothetical protein
MAGMCCHVGFLQSIRATLEVVLHYFRRQIDRRITFTLSFTNIFTHKREHAHTDTEVCSLLHEFLCSKQVQRRDF